MLSCHDSRAAPQIAQSASPVCGTKNFSSVRLYSAPQVHCTIVTIPANMCFGPRNFQSGNCHNRTEPPLRAHLRLKLVSNTVLLCEQTRCSLASWPSLCCLRPSRWTEEGPLRVIRVDFGMSAACPLRGQSRNCGCPVWLVAAPRCRVRPDASGPREALHKRLRTAITAIEVR